MVLFTLGWIFIALVFDIAISLFVVTEVRTLTWDETSGVVRSSRVETSNSSAGIKYSFAVTYGYEVEGERYVGQRYRVSSMTSSDKKRPQALADAHPVGREVIVYYAPDQPERSVLERGISPMTWALFLFLSPFNAVAITLICIILGLRRFGPDRPYPIRRVTTDPGRIEITYARSSLAIYGAYPWLFLGLPFALGGLVAAFAADPKLATTSIQGALAVLILSSAGTLLVATVRRWHIGTIVIDVSERRVRVPGEPPIEFDAMEGVNSLQVPLDGLASTDAMPASDVVLRLRRDGRTITCPLFENQSPSRAEELVEWTKTLLMENGAIEARVH